MASLGVLQGCTQSNATGSCLLDVEGLYAQIHENLSTSQSGLREVLLLAPRPAGGARALPSPATHVILAHLKAGDNGSLKAGESVFQTRLLTKTVVHGRTKRSTTAVSCTILASKYCLGRLFPRL